MNEKIPILNSDAKESSEKPENKPLITEESIGYELNEEEINNRKTIREDIEKAKTIRQEREEKEQLEYKSLEISDKVLEKAGVLNISKEDLGKINGFKELSTGQQRLALENLSQIALSDIKEGALAKQKESYKKTGFFGKLLSGVKKNYNLVKFEREKAKEVTEGGIARHGENLKNLVDIIKNGPPLEYNNNGAPEIKFLDPEKFPDKQKAIIEAFNEAASEFSMIPEERGFVTAGKKERNTYLAAKMKYEMATRGAMEALQKSGLKEKEMFSKMNTAESYIRMQQFFNTNRDIEKELYDIKNKNILVKIFKNTAGEKAVYMAGGYLARASAIGVFGAIGAPLGAAITGGWIAGSRASKELAEREKLARKGVEDKSLQAKNFVKAENLSGKLEEVLVIAKNIDDLLVAQPDSPEIKKIASSLFARIKYTKEKLDNGLVNFGQETSAMLNRYNLLQKLAEAGVMAEMIKDGGSNLNLEKRLDSFLDLKRKNISKKRRNYIIKKAFQGAGIAASFAFGGYLIRHFAGEWFGWDKKTEAAIKTSGEIKEVENAVPGGVTAISENYPPEETMIINRGVRAMPESYPPKETIIIGRGVRAMPEHYPGVGGVKDSVLELKTELAAAAKPEITEKLADIFSGSSVKDSLAKMLNYEVADANYKFSGGKHIIKNFYEKGFNLILKSGEGGKTIFGIDGPPALGKYNWGEEGKSWLFKADAEFNEENLNKAVKFIKKAADTFYKGPSDYTKQGWSE
mgnify:CR=1 FL=1